MKNKIVNKLTLAAACILLVGSFSYGVTILSVAGSNGSQGQGGAITNNTLSNIYADFATLNAALGGPGSVNVAAGKTLTVSNTLTLAGTDSTTITFPSVSVSMIGTSAQSCGATATCSATAATSQKVVTGSGTLVSGTPSTFALTGISPAFTSSSTFLCNAVDTTTAANNIGVLTAGYVSGSAVTFTGPNTNTDTFRYSCVGN